MTFVISPIKKPAMRAAKIDVTQFRLCYEIREMEPVTIASVRAHGVRRLLVYCRGKREGDWIWEGAALGDCCVSTDSASH